MGLSDRSNLLFSNLDLRASLDARRQAIDSEVRALDPNRLLNTSPDDLARFFVEKYPMEPPALYRDQWSVESKEETETREDYGHRFTATVQRLYVHIPFVGDRDLFMSRASTFTMSPPRGVVGAQTLTLAFTPGQQGGPEAVRALIDREIDEVERHLAWIRNDLEAYNGSLGAIADQAIRRRREQVLHQQGLVAGLGIPLRERAGAPETYVVPAVRRKAVPTLPAASTAPFKPEPVLAMEHYDHILDVIQNMTTVMERSPATFARMDEESLRDHYLVQLNGHYQGSATGEKFNNQGKTDILIREQDRNIFIAECKFWKGAKGYAATIDQLLGYSAWRDTKTAIVVFNRNRDTTKVLEEVKKTTEAHANYKRTPAWTHESGYRFVMHHPADSNRELIMTVLVFDVPAPAPRGTGAPAPVTGA